MLVLIWVKKSFNTLTVFLKEFFEKLILKKVSRRQQKHEQLPSMQTVNPLYSGNPLTSTFANSEDPDEMQHNTAFHQGLQFL